MVLVWTYKYILDIKMFNLSRILYFKFYLANHCTQVTITQQRILGIPNSRWVFCRFVIAESSPF